MAEVVTEMHGADGWMDIGSLPDFLPPGSISSYPGGRREIYIFGWLQHTTDVPDGPGVWRSDLGMDTETDAVRAILSLKLTKMADLERGSYEITWHRKAGGQARVRWRLQR